MIIIYKYFIYLATARESNSSKKIIDLGCFLASSNKVLTYLSLSPWYLLRISDGRTLYNKASASHAAA